MIDSNWGLFKTRTYNWFALRTVAKWLEIEKRLQDISRKQDDRITWVLQAVTSGLKDHPLSGLAAS